MNPWISFKALTPINALCIKEGFLHSKKTKKVKFIKLKIEAVII